MFAQNAQRDQELARIREDIRRTTREIIRLAKQEMQKARNRVQQPMRAALTNRDR